MHKSLHCELDLRYIPPIKCISIQLQLSSTHLFSLCHKLS